MARWMPHLNMCVCVRTSPPADRIVIKELHLLDRRGRNEGGLSLPFSLLDPRIIIEGDRRGQKTTTSKDPLLSLLPCLVVRYAVFA